MDDVAKILHVTPRTLHNWNSGRYDIPYAAFKLLRVLMRYELPDAQWQGWHFQGGRLYSPEGHSFAPEDSAWWSLLVRRAEMFSVVYAQLTQLQGAGRTATGPDGGTQAQRGTRTGAAQVAPTGEAGRAAQQPGPNSFLGHFGTEGRENPDFHREAPPPVPAVTWSVSANNWPVNPPLRWVTSDRGKTPTGADLVSRAVPPTPTVGPHVLAAPAGLQRPTLPSTGTTSH